MFAEFLDDVSKADFGDEDNGYYRYLYAPATIPAGTYSPSFVARDGSIEFLTTFRVRPDERVPEPGTLLLLAAGLGLAARRVASEPPYCKRATGANTRFVRGAGQGTSEMILVENGFAELQN